MKFRKSFRIYESWYEDLIESDLSNEEKWLCLNAICKCQQEMSVKGLELLSERIKWKIGINTLRMQLERIIEKSREYSERGKLGYKVKEINQAKLKLDMTSKINDSIVREGIKDKVNEHYKKEYLEYLKEKKQQRLA